MASSQSSSYGGIPLTNTTYQAGTSGLGGSGMNQTNAESWSAAWPSSTGLGMAPMAVTTPTPAAGMLSGAEGDAQGLYALGQQGAGPAFNNAIGAAQNNASGMNSIAGGLNGATAGNLTYANQALTDAFDPQKAAYNYYMQQALSTAGAQEALGGYAGTPYGAEVTGATGANFANQWQTAQIGRESTGAQTATGLQNQYMGQQQAAANILDQAGNLDVSAAQQLLGQYGVQGTNMAAALAAMTQLFGDMRVQTSQSSSLS